MNSRPFTVMATVAYLLGFVAGAYQMAIADQITGMAIGAIPALLSLTGLAFLIQE